MLLLLPLAVVTISTPIPRLVPSVRSLERLQGPDVIVSGDDSLVKAPAHLSTLAASFQAELKLAGGSGLRIELRDDDMLSAASTQSDVHGVIGGPEGYGLVVTVEDGVTISAGTERGLFYGTRTALQLLKGARRKGRLPSLRIRDSPVSQYRGLMIDNVRNAHNASFHMDFIEKLAQYKLNVYHIHSSDDQGYSLPSSLHPNLPMSSALTVCQAVRGYISRVGNGIEV